MRTTGSRTQTREESVRHFASFGLYLHHYSFSLIFGHSQVNTNDTKTLLAKTILFSVDRCILTSSRVSGGSMLGRFRGSSRKSTIIPKLFVFFEILYFEYCWLNHLKIEKKEDNVHKKVNLLST